jgi:heptosyltransferase III
VSQGKILVVRGGAIGDFILTLPVFSALREQFPQPRIELLGYPHVAGLAQIGGLVDAVRSIEAQAMAGFFAKDGVLDESLQGFFASFAVIISYLYDPDRVFQANVARCSKAQFIAGPHRPDERAGVHATDVFLKPLERLAVFSAESAPRLKILDAGVIEPEWLAVHPGSGSERKNWPEKNWVELLTEVLREDRRKALIVGGEAEGERVQRLTAQLPRKQIEIAQSLALVGLAQRLARCGVFIGHDSGISHLAAALGVPTLVLWGESVEAVWRPKGPRVLVLKPESGLQSLAPGRVIDALQQMESEAKQIQRTARDEK